MVDEAQRVVHTLLELNVLNLQQIEAHLKQIAARATLPQVKKWVLTVARNHIVNLDPSSPEVRSEYAEYTTRRPRHGIHTDMPEPEKLPSWASKVVGDKAAGPIHFFDPAQPRRRAFWQSLETIVDWFNATLKANDPAVNRIDRVGFEQAQRDADAWRKGVDENPWAHINDRPPKIKTYSDGYTWVRLVNGMHLKREGELMGHCVGGYGNAIKTGTEIYSLRDPNNGPHITVEVIKDGHAGKSVRQMKGKGNKKAEPKYQPYLADLIQNVLRLPVEGDGSYVDMAAVARIPKPAPKAAPARAA